MCRVVFLLLGLSAGWAFCAPLATLAEVRALSAAEAAKERSVWVEGVVILAEPGSGNIIIHDGTTGCYVTVLPQPGQKILEPGTRVRVKGVTNSGSFFPDIKDAEITWISSGTLPEPRKVPPEDLFLASMDSDWVEIEAVVIATEAKGLAYTLAVEVGGQTYKADVMQLKDADRLAAALMQRKVRLQGIVGTVYNENRQLTGRHFMVPSFDQIILVDPARPGTPPARRMIGSLLQNDQTINERVLLRGVITSPGIGGFYLRDASCSTFVRTAHRDGYLPGTEVEVEGFSEISPFRPTFRAIEVKMSGRGEVPAPVVIQPESESYWSFKHNELVRISCEFLSQRAGPDGSFLQCRAGEIFFEAWLPDGTAAVALRPGDQLALAGILECTTTRPIPRLDWVDGFRIHLPDLRSVEIIRRAPWWNTDRILIALGIAGAAMLSIFVWNSLLRRQVSRQAAIIRRQAEIGVVKDERQRIARELHDTLEQELTGLSLQLGNVAAVIREDDTPVRQSLTLAQQMLQHCRLEARASVSDLRDPNLLARDFAEALRESLTNQTADTGVTLDFSATGPSQPLRATTQNHLLRIAREAAFNSLRHGQPTRIVCRLVYTEEGVELAVEDDGVGFDSSEKPPVGHFGLTGMRERANKIQARLTVTSTRGSGTTIHLYLPYSSPEALPRTPSCP